MTLAPVMLYPGGRLQQKLPPIRTQQGDDIRALLDSTSAAAGITPALLLACLTAESDLDARAERWGLQTAQAQQALAAGDMGRLQTIIAAAGADISFGLGQRIVKFHYHGNGQSTVANVLDVRQFVFDHMAEDVRQAAIFLAPKLAEARRGNLSPCGGDELLGALAAYNAGHFPGLDEAYWHDRATTVARYKQALAGARTLL